MKYEEGKVTHISRSFLVENKYDWSEKILLIKKTGITSEEQAKFLEKFLQQRFNLFDS